MLTAEQIAVVKDRTDQLAEPITEYLLQDIAQRVSEAGQLTSTASYQVWRAQQLGLSQKEITAKLKSILKVSNADIKKLLTQSAKVGYNFDIKSLPKMGAIPFSDNLVIQQTVSAAVKMAQADFTNLTRTLGMVDPFGHALPLQDVYRKSCDFAFQQVFAGATDYNTAIRRATANLAKYGVQSIEYKSGVHTSIEAAVRRNIMGAVGTMSNDISEYNHDTLGCDGWELSAHAACAPDHEPYQGRQYSDADYKALNESLLRHIGTLNCGHMAFPIILGVSKPQYSDEDLAAIKRENDNGITYQGRHYTTYEAAQQQRLLERSIRFQKRRVLLSDGTGDTKQAQTASTRLTILKQEYKRFSKAAGLPTQDERVQVEGFGQNEAANVSSRAKAAEKIAEQSKSEYNIKREKVIQQIRSPDIPKALNIGNQNKHIPNSVGYMPGRSYIYGDLEVAQKLVDQYHGTGEIRFADSGEWTHKEFIQLDHDIGVRINQETGEETPTNAFAIHYGKKGTHIVPARRRN